MNDLILKLAEMAHDSGLETELLNLAGGETQAFNSPAELMLTLAGNNVFSEKYYDGVLDQRQRKTGLSETMELLPPRARLLVATATEVANSDNPRDLLALAAWARQEANMRTTPAWMLAVAAHEPKTKQFVVEYCRRKQNSPLVRPDDILEAFKAYVVLYGSPLAACLKKGLAEAYTKTGEYGMVKYNPKEWPTHNDVLRMIDRRKDYPLSKAMAEFLNSGDVIDEAALPLIATRKKLAKKTEFDAEAKEMARKSRATWENLLSQFGSNKEVWELGVEIMTGKSEFDGPKRVNYMALLRNLCNFAEAGISAKHWAWVYSVLTDEEEVKNSRQLPFRYLSAYDQVVANRAFDETTHKNTIEALDKAAQISCRAVFNIHGTSVIAPDHSGSMESPAMGDKTTMTCRKAADVMAVIAFCACEEAYAIPFGTEAVLVKLSHEDGFFKNLDKLTHCRDIGYGTNGDKVIQVMNQNNIKADRVVYITDGQMYRGLSDAWKTYRDAVPNCWMHVVDMGGYGTKVGNSTIGNEKRNQIGGFSEKLLNFCVRAEVGDLLTANTETETEVKTIDLPSMEYIRTNF